MSNVNVERLARPGLVTIRRGNRRTAVYYSAHRGRFFVALAAAFLFVSFSLAIVWSGHQIVQTGYDISRLQKETADLTDYNRKLKVELANLTALDRLEQVARDELGLRLPEPGQVQVIE
ncbi:MAG: cell division protein FtsL [Thermodesulfobacteriota bacterium]